MSEQIRRFILDTDIGPDCDDSAALALALVYARSCGGKLLGVTHCTSSPWGVGAIRSILDWYGEGDIPVGTLGEKGFLDKPGMAKYNKALALTVEPERREAEDAQKILKEILEDQPDGSVELISVGPLKNIGDLISTEEGIDLVGRKVSRLTMMAGNFSPECSNPEFNVEMDIRAAQRIAEKWPSELIYCGWEVGAPVVILKDKTALKKNDPVRMAYELYCGDEGRSSWDLCTVQWAFDPESPMYSLSRPGNIEVDDEGYTHFRCDKNGRHFYLSLAASPEKISASLEDDLKIFDAAEND